MPTEKQVRAEFINRQKAVDASIEADRAEKQSKKAANVGKHNKNYRAGEQEMPNIDDCKKKMK